jgi:F-type H+-transporting ATPase subunit b
MPKKFAQTQQAEAARIISQAKQDADEQMSPAHANSCVRKLLFLLLKVLSRFLRREVDAKAHSQLLDQLKGRTLIWLI